MGQIRAGKYEMNGVGFEVTEQNEFTMLTLAGETWTFNANGFNVTPLNPAPTLASDVEDGAEGVEDVQNVHKNRGSSASGNSAE